MAIRFSIKWLLLATAYIALVAAAFNHRWQGYGELLWCASFLAIVYAMLVVFTARGPRQVRALGFALAFLACAGSIRWGGPSPPAPMLLLSFMNWIKGPDPPLVYPQRSSSYTGIIDLSAMPPSYVHPIDRRHMCDSMTPLLAGLSGIVLAAMASASSKRPGD